MLKWTVWGPNWGGLYSTSSPEYAWNEHIFLLHAGTCLCINIFTATCWLYSSWSCTSGLHFGWNRLLIMFVQGWETGVLVTSLSVILFISSTHKDKIQYMINNTVHINEYIILQVWSSKVKNLGQSNKDYSYKSGELLIAV